MKKPFISLVYVMALAGISQAQNILNAKMPADIRKEEVAEIYDSTSIHHDGPLPYERVESRDVMWSRMVWETIDLSEKVNYPYYYPLDAMTTDRGRMSLFDALMTGIQKGEITAVYADSYFRQKLTKADIEQNTQRIDTLDLGIEQANAGEAVSPEYIDKVRISAADIRMFKIRGVWYFDKHLGALRYRLLGIAPVAPDIYQQNDGADAADWVELFWVWYRDARKTLYSCQVSNPNNRMESLSYDDLLNARRFSSSIYKVSNAYGDEEIKDLYPGDTARQIAESLRLKEQILNFENDQWSY